jgi:hypothetical protein
MGIRNNASSLIFFVYWDRRRLPTGRQACLPVGRERPIINLAPIIFLSFLSTGKVVDNQKTISQV